MNFFNVHIKIRYQILPKIINRRIKLKTQLNFSKNMGFIDLTAINTYKKKKQFSYKLTEITVVKTHG